MLIAAVLSFDRLRMTILALEEILRIRRIDAFGQTQGFPIIVTYTPAEGCSYVLTLLLSYS